MLHVINMVPCGSSSIQGFNRLVVIGGWGGGKHCAAFKGPTLKPLPWSVVICGDGQCILPALVELLIQQAWSQ